MILRVGMRAGTRVVVVAVITDVRLPMVRSLQSLRLIVPREGLKHTSPALRKVPGTFEHARLGSSLDLFEVTTSVDWTAEVATSNEVETLTRPYGVIVTVHRYGAAGSRLWMMAWVFCHQSVGLV